ncbi:MAG: 2-succinyl-5-enolpyruvyl-6-hydroxy-3-cyclohexene-1-carboxylic-acid synthase, partial [Chloroflexota bacterium]
MSQAKGDAWRADRLGLMLSTLDPTYLFTGAVVDEFARAGVHQVCLCPGSRSTPLAISFARDSRFRLWTHLDERSAAFFALGIAKSLGRPAIVLCTSGTAAANFMPAVVEARYAGVPLLVLTADRPPELRDCGAAQTIDQIRFYGAHVKWSVEMAVPVPRDDVLRYARVTACRALTRALEAPAGPVHLNFPFREPLLPTPAPDEQLASLSVLARQGRAEGLSFTAYSRPGLVPDPMLLNELAKALLDAPRGLIICGPVDEPDLAAPLTILARRLGYPILADPLSGLRCGSHDAALVLDSYDMLLRDEHFLAQPLPRIALRFGAQPTAKPLLEYLQRRPEIRQILVARSEPQDPTLLAAECVRADPTLFCTALSQALDSLIGDSTTRPAIGPWARTWLAAGAATRAALNTAVAAMDEPFEGRIFTE